MALNPVRPRLRNISNGLAKIQVAIPAGDEVEVSAEVAAQIAHQGAPLRPVDPDSEPEPAKKAPAKKKAPVKKAPAKSKD